MELTSPTGRLGLVLAVLAAVGALGGCAGEGPPPAPSRQGVLVDLGTGSARPTTGGTTRTSAAATTPPGAERDALAAYRSYLAATVVSSRTPPRPGRPWPAGGDFTAYSVDPVRTLQVAALTRLGAQGQRFVGVPVSPRPRVTRVGQSVTITDCPEPAQGWRVVDSSGATVWSPPPDWAPQPHLMTATVVWRDGRWAVAELVVETGRTCTP